MTVRVAYGLCGITPGREFEELKDLTQLVPMGFGDPHAALQRHRRANHLGHE